ncbi:MAG: RtcB family protein [Anaerolineae bacterium]|nr:RtcB family protein [Anaerolineae bacterium]
MQEIKVNDQVTIKQLDDYTWQVPRSGDMRVPGRIYTDRAGIKELVREMQSQDWSALKQIVNVACLPGIQTASLAMADIHPGYGFPIGGVGAFSLDEGVVSMAGVGYDINCGVRTLRTMLHRDDIEDKKEDLANALYQTVPAGLGSEGNIHLTMKEMDKLLIQGAEWVVRRGYGLAEDLDYVEERGCIAGADPDTVSAKAKERELKQIGSLGSGNHYLEVQWVETVFDPAAADAYGLFPGQILISIHSGSRALGHQIGADSLKLLDAASRRYNIPIRDRELVCAPFDSPEGREYMAAVYCGINVAFANRQALAYLAREAFQKALRIKPGQIATLYEVAHNTAKVETHTVDGVAKKLVVHRKGATRAFGPGRPEVPEAYRAVGQPVLVGGTMGTCSYILSGTQRAMDATFGSALHGAGRTMSRNQAIKQFRADDLIRRLDGQGIIVRGHSKKGLAEEAPGAYKDVDEVVEIMHNAGIVHKVARVRPLICIKG